jgi:hypothetical protein
MALPQQNGFTLASIGTFAAIHCASTQGKFLPTMKPFTFFAKGPSVYATEQSTGGLACARNLLPSREKVAANWALSI